MKSILKLEELAQLILAVYLNSFLPFDWYWYWIWFLSPDISFLGYIVNTNVGAWTYNILHHKAIAIAVYIAGIITAIPEIQFAGLLLFGHSAFDRMLGYGLKYSDSFQHTHLGWIGKNKQVKV